MIEGISGNQLFGSAALLGIITMLWGYIKVYLSKFIGLFIIRGTVTTYGLTRPLILYLLKDFKCSNLSVKTYFGDYVNVISQDKSKLLAFEAIPTEPTIWWDGYKPLIVSISGSYINLTFLRFTFNLKEIIINATITHEESESMDDKPTRFYILHKHGTLGEKSGYNQGSPAQPTVEASIKSRSPSDGIFNDYMLATPIGLDRRDIGSPSSSKKNFMSFYEKTDSLEHTINEMEIWKKNEKWFKTRNITWKRGYIFYGIPGTGKTAFARILGQHLDTPVYTFDLSTMTNKDLFYAWSDMLSASPAIALIEDIDAVFNGRKNVATSNMNQGLSFDYLLNIIDGISSNDGVILIITTNDINKIDSAMGVNSNGDEMSTRPGRIDRVVEFKELTEKGKNRMANRILSDFPKEMWQDIFEHSQKDTGAQFQERCVRKANQLFWEKKAKI